MQLLLLILVGQLEEEVNSTDHNTIGFWVGIKEKEENLELNSKLLLSISLQYLSNFILLLAISIITFVVINSYYK